MSAGPSPKKRHNRAALWKVVGGGEKGGIVTRVGQDVSSAFSPEGRLATGAIVEELELLGERLHFQRLSGEGPASGWASLRLANGKELLSSIEKQVWEVVGGADKGGIIVRQAMNTSSPEAAGGRLSTRSLVEQVELVGERLHYTRLTGMGPDTGWVSIALHGKDLLVRWEVTSGAGGQNADPPDVPEIIRLLRDHHDTSFAHSQMIMSELLPEAKRKELTPELCKLMKEDNVKVQRKAIKGLAILGTRDSDVFGALAQAMQDKDVTVRCEAAIALGSLELEGQLAETCAAKLLESLRADAYWRVRLHSARSLLKLGPAACSSSDLQAVLQAEVDLDVQKILVKGLQARGAAAELKASVHANGAGGDQSRADGQKIRVVAVHGANSNSPIMKFQTAKFKAALGADAEWIFVDSPMVWTPIPGSEDPLFMEPSPIEKSLSKGQPFSWWYSHGNTIYNAVDEGVQNLLEAIERASPVDVVVSFSQGSNCVSLALDALRRSGKHAPWKLSVMVLGGQIDDPIFQWPESWVSDQPTLRVLNKGHDSFFSHQGGEGSLKHMYSNLLEIEHGDGHMFPRSEPRASEIYVQLAQEIRKQILDAQ